MIIDKEKYYNEVKRLALIKRFDERDFDLLFKLAIGEEIEIDRDYLVEKIVRDLFYNGITIELMIPWGFLQTEIGKAILYLKFGIDNSVYFANDIAKMLGISKQQVLKDVKSVDGNAPKLRGTKRDGNWTFDVDAVREYIKLKGKGELEELKKLMYEEMKEKIISSQFEREEPYGNK